jgi:gentisate 1,2-dioxygenase
MKDMMARLDKMANEDQWDGKSRYVSLKSADADYNATIPTMWTTLHCLKPGECIEMHRHTPGSM